MGEDFITYEHMIESIEGPAWYVEMNAYNAVCKMMKATHYENIADSF